MASRPSKKQRVTREQRVRIFGTTIDLTLEDDVEVPPAPSPLALPTGDGNTNTSDSENDNSNSEDDCRHEATVDDCQHEATVISVGGTSFSQGRRQADAIREDDERRKKQKRERERVNASLAKK